MTTFDEREKGFEAKYKHDQELRFKVTARRNRLLGLWAADLMGLEGEAAEAYAREVVQADFEAPGDEDVLEKVRNDLRARNIDKSAHQIRRRMEELLEVAKEQVMEENAKK